MEPSVPQAPADASSDYEFLSPIGYANSSRCGYCGNRDPKQSKRFSYYVTATSLSPKFYQTLLDRCWRRSGKLLYRPNQRQACCPHYTIRLDAARYQPSRDQRQTVNRFNRYVLGESYIKEAARLYPRSRKETKKRDNEFCLTERVHEAEAANLKTPPEPAHRLVITLEEDVFTEEKYRVYDNYQKVVHHEAPEDRTRRSFKRFLCSSPLRRQTVSTPDGRKRRLGSYHQCYRVDGELVAIGVLDLLPECVSSVYFLYHESIHKFTPGKLGAVHEIALALEEGYRWWYPGFYIHNCPKMRYKIDYTPQYILDPQALTWDPLDKEALGILDKKKFLSLSLERKDVSEARGPSLEPTSEPKSASAGDTTDEAGDDDDDDGDVDDDDDEASVSLFQSDMPGIPSIADMEKVDLDHIALKIFPTGPLFETSDLVSWESKKITDWPSIRASVAELVAALGPDLADSICLDSSSRH